MLQFLRKYQAIVLVIVGVALLLPFSFFGTYRAISAFQKQKEVVLGRSLDGSKYTLSDVQQLAQLLQAEKNSSTLFMELLRTGAVERLCEIYAKDLQKEWQTRLDRVKRSSFYVHPASPLVNARALWIQLAPELMEEIKVLQECQELPVDFVSRWIKLYFMQEKCPAELIRRVLLHQQNQMKLAQDPHLFSDDFSLFGYRSIHDWFGREFFQLCAQLIINGAADARERGFDFEDEKVEFDLQHRFSTKEADYALVVRSLGVGHQDAIRLWKKALLFMAVLNDIGQSVLIDDLGVQKVSEFANETALIELYTLPPELQFHVPDDYFAYKAYEEMRTRSDPGLLFTRYRLRYTEADLKKMRSRIPINDVWEWELDHWSELRKKFSKLPDAEKGTRFQILEKQENRSRIDEWSREKIVEEHPEWLEMEFASALIQEREITISIDNKRIDFLPIQKIGAFRTFLEGNLEKEFRDGQTILRINAVEKVADQELISLVNAKQNGMLNTHMQKLREQGSPTDIQETFKQAMEGILISLKQGETSLNLGLWTLRKTERTITRNSSSDWLYVEPFLLSPGQWSSLSVSGNGELAFFFLKERSYKPLTPEERFEQVRLGKEALIAEVQRLYIDQLLQKIQNKKAIVFPLGVCNLIR